MPGSASGVWNIEGEYKSTNKYVSFGSSNSGGEKKIKSIYKSGGDGYEEKLSKL